MLVKEYRIPLPLTVDEYRIAQLYMIQKKSRQESSGAGSGVEILKNEPYADGPGGSGQYTYKVYHIGSHLPSWFRAILPKSALRVDEEAWNAYPYTKTIFKCPFVEKFSITIETVYKPDFGTQENIFNLRPTDLRNRVIDVLDFVKDQLPSNDYKKEEDPHLYKSVVTGRGPLTSDWLKERMILGAQAGPTMCAYKLCSVEFKYWGMQSKIEKFIHETALRKTMVRAHRQAWTWQDEWYGLSIDDIRDLEVETQQALAKKMFSDSELIADGSIPKASTERRASMERQDSRLSESGKVRRSQWEQSTKTRSKSNSVHHLSAQSSSGNRVSWNSFENIQDSSDDEFFDAQDAFEEEHPCVQALARSSSMDMITEDFSELSVDPTAVPGSPARQRSKAPGTLDEYSQCKLSHLFIVLHGGNALLVESDKNPKMNDLSTLKSTFDKVIVSHYSYFKGQYTIKLVSCPPIHSDALNLLASISPYSYECSEAGGQFYNEYFPISAVPMLATNTIEYQDALVTVANRANKVYRDFLLSDEGQGFRGQVVLIGDCMGSVMAFDVLCSHHCDTFNQFSTDDRDSASSKKYASETNLKEAISSENTRFDFSARRSTSSEAFKGSFNYLDVQCKKESLRVTVSGPGGASMPAGRLSNMASANPSKTPASSAHLGQQGHLMETRGFDFDVSDFFMFGCPLALVLAQRITTSGPDCLPRPNCFQVYNLFHSTDPCAGRLESLLESRFSQMHTVKICRYQKFPLGDGLSNSLLDCLQKYGLFTNESTTVPSPLCRQGSNASYLSNSSVDANLDSIASVARKWWGCKRIDYALYCPEALESFPANSLPHLFHASYWESMDVVSFMLRQLLQDGNNEMVVGGDVQCFQPSQPREKWTSRRTAIKTKNITPNHRGNDVIVLEDKQQILSARFMYGPLDVVTLSGEKVDVHIVTDDDLKEWEYFGTQVTDKYGRATFTIPEHKRLSLGLYPVKMVVRGDHTFTDFSMLVLPPNTGVVVFSIDGSFTASVSIMGKDPKVRPGAVDVVRHWQDLGYCILYISARPDMQLRKVVSWLAQHNFPHGMVAFMDGLSADPIRQKAQYLKTLVQESTIDLVAAYGSHKDIAVYHSLNVPHDRIYIVGKVPKKAYSQAQVLSDGYAAHLQEIQTNNKVGPSTGNARLYMQKSSFTLYGKAKNKSSKKHNALAPAISIDLSGNTTVDAGMVGGNSKFGRVRGRSPRHSKRAGVAGDS